jgi:hypothetical protein
MITDFPDIPLSNMSGMQAFSFVPAQNINLWPPVLRSKTASGLVFNVGTFFKGYSTIDMLEFIESTSKDDNGTLFNWQVNGFYPGDSDVYLDLFQSIQACRELVVLAKDNNGMLRLVGYKAPLEFNYTFNPGKVAGSDPRGYSFSFSGQGGQPAPIYDTGE